MSSATHVPETYELGQELDIRDARAAFRSVGTWQLIKDSYTRFRYGDGFTSSRALALQLCLAIVPLAIFLEGAASVLVHGAARRVLTQTLLHLMPTGQSAIHQLLSHTTKAAQGSGGIVALVFGLVTALVSLSTGFAQIQRGANRIYGIQRDRPTLQRYTHATVLALTLGSLSALAFALMVTGGPFGDAMHANGFWSSTTVTVWTAIRWPVGAVLAVLSITILFDRAPRRHQPARSWLGTGAAIAVVLWLGLTLLLALYVTKSPTFGSVYGPLTWVIALLFWALLTSIALFLGLALAAQLEAVRAGVAEPALANDEEHDVVATRVRRRELAPRTRRPLDTDANAYPPAEQSLPNTASSSGSGR
ncbi:MAG TPA: YihY/virulence factor BrkB family protein [Mycobacteriales bacterium]|jgi:YihY family inner membrane protein|nr:YihY/virulence factor BrkB family protein [Mycobacteriales bacterium]